MKFVLHIGPPKTGTSSIQFFLKRNRGHLLTEGVFVARTKGAAQQEFRLIARERRGRQRRERRSLAKWGIHSVEDLQERKEAIRTGIEEQLEVAARTCRMAVISAEGLARQSVEEMTNLRAILSPYATSFLIVVYLRRQDLHQISKAKNNSKEGRIVDPFETRHWSYAELLDRWAGLFGEENIKPLIFADSSHEKADHLGSFLKVCGLDHLDFEHYVMPGKRNANIDARSLRMLELVNHFLPAMENGKVPPERVLVEEVLQRGFPDHRPYRPRREDAQKYFALHAEDNEKVRRRWFPDLPTLFHDDFSMYPEEMSECLTLPDCAYLVAEMAKTAIAQRRPARTEQPQQERQGASAGKTVPAAPQPSGLLAFLQKAVGASDEEEAMA
jgi:hypothetical protein